MFMMIRWNGFLKYFLAELILWGYQRLKLHHIKRGMSYFFLSHLKCSIVVCSCRFVNHIKEILDCDEPVDQNEVTNPIFKKSVLDKNQKKFQSSSDEV